MSPKMIATRWREMRDPVSREKVIQAFLDCLAPSAAEVILELGDIEMGQRFLFEVRGYLTNPAKWRQQARAHFRKHHGDKAA